MSFGTTLVRLLLYPLVRRVIQMPGRNPKGGLPELDGAQRESCDNLRRIVYMLASEIGERNIRKHDELLTAQDFLVKEFNRLGYAVRIHTFNFEGVEMANVEAELAGTVKSDEVVVIGAHYDTVEGSPGADDNATGVAALIEIASKLAGESHQRTLRLVAFANEENSGGLNWETMGSAFYARACRAYNDNIVSMIALEMLGFYSEEAGSQRYPNPLSLFYPDTGNFVAFIGKQESGTFVRRCIKKFREKSLIHSQGVAAPEALKDIHRSDHWGFWQCGYHNALMVTDTANYRNPNYHSSNDIFDTIDFTRLTLVTSGLATVVKSLLND